jgi:hypothetical protein
MDARDNVRELFNTTGEGPFPTYERVNGVAEAVDDRPEKAA